MQSSNAKLTKEMIALGKLIDARNKLFDKYQRMPIRTETQIRARNNIVRRINEYDEKIKPQKSGIVLPL